MTEAMPFLQKAILLSYDPRPFAPAGQKVWKNHMALWKVRWMTSSCCSRLRRLKFTA